MAGRSRRKLCLYVFIFMSTCLGVDGIEEFFGHCGQNIDLMMARSTHSGLLTMPLPHSMSKFQDPARPIHCDILLTFTSGTNLLIELYFLDIMPVSGDVKTCTTGLEIFDQTGSKYYGSRICMEGWQWEERHREKNHEKYLVQNSPLTFRLSSSGAYRGEGFKLHFNQVRPGWPCYIHEYKCRQVQRCVHDTLACDGWDDCGDNSDERYEAGCHLLSASEICSLIMGILLVMVAIIEIVMFVITYRRFAKEYGLKLDCKDPVTGNKNNMESGLDIGHRHNSQDSLPSRNSKLTVPAKKRPNSPTDSINKLDLEKANRHNQITAEDMSERSFHSNSRRKRAQSQGNDFPSEPSGRSRHHYREKSSSRSKLNHERFESDSGIVNPALDNEGSLKQSRSRSHERMSNRDINDKYDRDVQSCSDSDSNYDDKGRYQNQRRRSSRERSREHDFKRRNQYSDEDTENDQDYRRRRSYDMSSDDSDYEREKRRKSRERYSRERYDDDRYSDDGKYADKQHQRRDSSGRERNWYENQKYRKSLYDDDDDRPVYQSRSRDRSHDTQSKNRNRQPGSQGNYEQQEKHRGTPPLPLPPPYSEEDEENMQDKIEKLSPAKKDIGHMSQQNQIPAKSSEHVAQKEKENLKQIVKELNEIDWRKSSNDRRDRYSQSRLMSQKSAQGSPPPEYKDIATKPASVGIIYREESV